METRELQFTEGTSDKFWRIALEGSSHTVTFGRRGTGGQEKTKSFADEAAARRDFDKLLAEKLKKGYTEVSAGPGASSPAPVSAARASAKTKAETPAPSPASSSATATSAEVLTESVSPNHSIPTVPVSLPLATSPLLPAETSIDLDPEDWAVATWRPCPPFPPSTDLHGGRNEALKETLSCLIKPQAGDPRGMVWMEARMPRRPSRDAALLWITALTTPSAWPAATDHLKLIEETTEVPPPALLVRRMTEEADPQIPDGGKGKPVRETRPKRLPGRMAFALAHFYSPAEIAEFVLLADQIRPPDRGRDVVLMDWLAPLAWIFRGSSSNETAQVQELISGHLDGVRMPAQSSAAVPAVLVLAAAAGLGERLIPLVEALSPKAYRSWYASPDASSSPYPVIFGLPSADLVAHHITRLDLPMNDLRCARWWLAHTGSERLDVLQSELEHVHRSPNTNLFGIIERVKAPRTAAVMLELIKVKPLAERAIKWLNAHPENAIPGLVEQAAGNGPLAAQALTLIKGHVKQGGEELLRRTLEQSSPKVQERIHSKVLNDSTLQLPLMDASAAPQWLVQVLADGKKLKIVKPAWLEGSLESLAFDGKRLPREYIDALLGALHQSTFETPHPLISIFREHIAQPELDRFAWGLFNGWLSCGSSPKEKWAMTALGLMGGDDTVNGLAPLVREWPGQSQHQRAVYGLDCMRVIGTDTALQQINRIALKLKFKALQNRARECMEAIASSRGLTRSELEDRVVPDLGLDDNGSRIFDYGSRQFAFAAGPDLKPMVREGTGKLMGDLPKPGAKDDPEKAPAALAEWKALKKSFKDEAKIQAARLEQAMVTQRRWTVKEFETLILRHPFMSLPARLLVWGAWNADAQQVGTFRITEDGTLGNSSDEPFDLSGTTATQVGIIHPLHLSPDDARAWGELFSDYAIVPPFPQIGREAHALEPGEESKTEITRFAKLNIPPMALWGTLASHGWWRGTPQDAGAVLDHIKQFHSANITVVADHEPIYISYPQEGEEGPISRVLFYTGIRRPDDIPHWSVGAKQDELLALGKVDPVVISEVLRDLYTIASKAK